MAAPAIEPPEAQPASDESLMQNVARGDAAAFETLFAAWKQPIHGFFRRRVFDPTAAEELTQDTFVALFRSAPRYEPRALFRTYLYAIALQLLRAHRRKTALRATFFGESEKEPSTPSSLDTAAILRDALSKLDRHEREILMLREFEQLSYSEISELLHLPLNTVRSRLFRARSALHTLLTSPAPATTATLTTLKERA